MKMTDRIALATATLKWDQWVAIGLSAFLLVYAALRAYLVPVVFDEVFTFTRYILTGAFQPFYSRLDANNHLINSTLGHLSFLAFGDGSFSIRLPNLLALLLYQYYLVRFRACFQHKMLWLAFFVGLSTIHYVFDFFALCRGYGLSIAFLTAALFHIWQYATTCNPLAYCVALIMLSLAVWSNLAVMTVVLVLGSFTLFTMLKFERGQYGRMAMLMGALVLIHLFPVVYAIQFSMALKDGGRLFLGTGIPATEAIGSGLSRLMFNLPPMLDFLPYAVVCLYYFLAVALLIKRRINWSTIGFHGAFTLSLIGVFAMHYLLDINFPIRRTAMHLPWLLLGSLFLLFDALPRTLARATGWVVSGSLVFNFLINMNLNHVMDWKYECVPKSFTDLMVQRFQLTGTMPSVSCGEYMADIISYQTRSSPSGIITASGPVYIDGQVDLVVASDGLRWGHLSEYDTLDFYAPTGTALMGRRNPTSKKLLKRAVPAILPSLESAFLFGFDSINSYAGHVLSYEMTMTAQCDRPVTDWTCYAQIWSETECISNTQFDLQPAHYDLQRPTKIRIAREVAIVRSDAVHFRCFIYAGAQNRELKLTDVQVSVFASESKP